MKRYLLSLPFLFLTTPSPAQNSVINGRVENSVIVQNSSSRNSPVISGANNQIVINGQRFSSGNESQTVACSDNGCVVLSGNRVEIQLNTGRRCVFLLSTPDRVSCGEKR